MNREYLGFFGAFNPPTNAHIRLAEFALKATGAKRVLFIPSKENYIRDFQGKDRAYGDRERLEMLRLAAETRPWMEVSDVEILQESQPRTYETLCRLRDAGKDAALLVGSDKLPELAEIWAHVDEIAREFGIVVLTRGADMCARMIRESAYLTSLSPYLKILETPADTRNISSTLVRSRVAQMKELQREIGAMVPQEILDLL
ncbi:MAG: nicotinate (nicotinamide) nucleotide adenylyltransferase [Clostridia bacterium]|nr:nicotinate (nicotinamide) nucleotide adenylyltransferase [Clostridia bacterium]